MKVSFKEKMEQMLCEHGMPRRHAQIVLECAIQSPKLKGINLWNKDSSKYSPMMEARLWSCVKAEALIWLKTNWPDAPFRKRLEPPVKYRGIEISM